VKGSHLYGVLILSVPHDTIGGVKDVPGVDPESLTDAEEEGGNRRQHRLGSFTLNRA
jgi:hypothetical protein